MKIPSSLFRKQVPCYHSILDASLSTFNQACFKNGISARESSRQGTKLFYFTNTDTMKKEDPYATLGLQWGATTSEIKEAYKKMARRLHPDVNKTDSVERALQKFKRVQLAYQKLMDVKGSHRDDLADEWVFRTWRKGDIIAQQRTDVAGAARKRPTKPADSEKRQWGVAAIGHPSGTGNAYVKAEYLGDGIGKKTGTVGTGRNKWVKPKKFEPWGGKAGNFKQMDKNGPSSKDKA